MKHNLILAVVVAGFLAGTWNATAAPAADGRRLDPMALEAVKDMSRFVAGLTTFRCRTEELVDGAAETPVGTIKLQYAISRMVTGRRPDELFVDADGDFARRKMWLRAHTLTALDITRGEWASMVLPSSPSETIRKVHDETGMIMPLGALLYRDLGRSLAESAEEALHLGERRVRGELCQHLFFRAAGYNWQLWIRKGDRPLPVKFVATETTEPSQPQHVVQITDWEIDPAIDEGAFAPQIPEGAKRVDTLPPIFGLPDAKFKPEQP